MSQSDFLVPDDGDEELPDPQLPADDQHHIPETGGSSTLAEVGLPPDYDFDRDARYIPTGGDLASAAVAALDYWTAFVVYHRSSSPQVIAEHLDEIASVALAASQVTGEHQRQAIRLGLSLGVEFWLERGKLRECVDLLMPLLETARKYRFYDLECEIFEKWGVCQHVADHESRAAEAALNVAEAYAEDSGRADLKLLVRVRRLGIRALGIPPQEVVAAVLTLLPEARQLNYDYAEGMLYQTLARVYQHYLLPREAFMYAQQALPLMLRAGADAYVGSCLSIMLRSLEAPPDGACPYQEALLTYQERLVSRAPSLMRSAQLSLSRCFLARQRGHWEEAREHVLRALAFYRRVPYRPTTQRVKHFLGEIQFQRGRLSAARAHLQAAYDFHAAHNSPAYAVVALCSLARTWQALGQPARARAAVEQARVEAQTLLLPEARKALLAVVDGQQPIVGSPRRTLREAAD